MISFFNKNDFFFKHIRNSNKQMSWEKYIFSEIPENIYENNKNKIIYPEKEDIFNAFHYCPEDNLKVVIIGQDCYYNDNQAIGLCFAVPNETKKPPSLLNIHKEIIDDIGKIETDNTLKSWAEQGVLLLNCSLTVEKKKPGSHIKYWRKFTNQIIYDIAHENENIVFCLWGNFAKSKANIISASCNNHLILEASHPSPLSANKGGWFGCKHFSKINTFLQNNGKTPIKW